ncbi:MULTISPECIES: SDR family oxidoreductase [unclassified Pseudomonas]|uniref:SDR family oxidoreductase n=1 Tax=unclassified Pseudomonas TaxID=196821 RepID=UPI002279838A|nr:MULTISPECIES: SDR family oxidoreductase [unclassified Pseudomonas]
MNAIYDFKGQVAKATGAVAGMGLTTARGFAHDGASVVLADRDGERSGEEAAVIVAGGRTAIGLACDLSDEAQVAALVEKTVAEYGRLDFAFHNSGVMAKISTFTEATSEKLTE